VSDLANTSEERRSEICDNSWRRSDHQRKLLPVDGSRRDTAARSQTCPWDNAPLLTRIFSAAKFSLDGVSDVVRIPTPRAWPHQRGIGAVDGGSEFHMRAGALGRRNRSPERFGTCSESAASTALAGKNLMGRIWIDSNRAFSKNSH
jgi:hypothetical protein